MTDLNCQDRRTGRTVKISVALVACRAVVLDYVARTYPQLHVVSFA